jgi:hypothetical protein
VRHRVKPGVKLTSTVEYTTKLAQGREEKELTEAEVRPCILHPSQFLSYAKSNWSQGG